MFALTAAKRTLVLMMSLALLVPLAAAQAGEDDGEGYLGVMLQELTPSMSKALQMGDQSGVMINEVVDDSPAAKAGLEDGDVILEFGGKTIADEKDLVKAVRAANPGDKVEVVLLRAGREKALMVEVGEHEAKDMFFMSKGDEFHAPHVKHFKKDGNKVIVMTDGDEEFVWSQNRGYLGVHLDDLNEQLGEYFGAEGGKGALVTEVVADSPAAAAGLKAGDVIVGLGNQEIHSSDALHKAMQDTEPEQQMEIQYLRQGQSKSLSITLGEMPADIFAKQMQIIGLGDDHWSIHSAPRMMKHFNWDADEWVEAEDELEEMREELDKMRQELKEMKKELKK
jgi:predicted metalloprotease with PDZ domain